MNLVPGMTIMAPSDESDMCGMLHKMAAHDDGPIMMRFPRGNADGVEIEDPESSIEIGKGKLVREGEDTTLYAIGSMVSTAVSAADILSDKGIEISVVNARFVKPADADLILGSSQGKDVVFTLEENVKLGGFGDSIREVFSEAGTGCRVVKIGIDDEFVPHGKRDELLAETSLDAISVARTIVGELKAEDRDDSGGGI